ncbi:glycerophosphodiester phosphodiesterase [Paucibacter sp. PLA-PC-4]|uniref:glycerophosphodiester phosphodiesterase n=1 Tax=Paucibacter sp. PLA-PC-4 TaxID=2993655 RepID=UPI00224AD8F6|nr:glycerophosphodiester phosphodiesterase [Paucibacter sp. PLA-PC-4]MCX2865259.1 glycerophosphodiester phosphodiesterase [Paucibacter sp. PLA-PC-4]
MGEWPMPMWIAHRGAGKLAPENTLAAFREGARHGYRAFECDVKLSADGIPFLLHDATLNRTTPERGVAGERGWAELSRIDAGAWHSRAYAGEPIPSLDALARYVIANGFALNIEIKPTPGQELVTGQVVGREVLRLWKGSGLMPLLSSFQPEALAGALQTAPELPRGLLLDKLSQGWLDQALRMQCRAVITNYALMNQALVEQLHAAGLKALVYTVNDPASAQWLMANGVDGIITDAVDRFSPGS